MTDASRTPDRSMGASSGASALAVAEGAQTVTVDVRSPRHLAQNP